MKTIDISKLSTKDLVAKYNELTGKSIKKFSSRAAGEKQVAAALAAISEKVVAPAKQKAAAVQPKKDHSAAIAASWKNPETAAKRSKRTHVKVGTKVYRSVAEAFKDLGLPFTKHVKFRAELKQHMQLTFRYDGKQITFHVVQEQ